MFISIILYIPAVFYCCLSGSHPEQVFSNIIDLGTTKTVSYLPWPRRCLGVALCIQVCGTTFPFCAMGFTSLPSPAMSEQLPLALQKSGKGGLLGDLLKEIKKSNVE